MPKPLRKTGLLNVSVFLLCLLFATGALAAKRPENHLENAYRAEVLALLDAIERTDYNELSRRPDLRQILADEGLLGLTIPTTAQMRTRLDRINFRLIPKFLKPQGSTRHTAFFDPSNDTIYLNGEATHPTQLIGLLGLHELLGIMGAPDQNYELTLLIHAYLKSGSERFSREIQKQFFRHLVLAATYVTGDWLLDLKNNQLAMGGEGNGNGGGTIVGGGGDHFSLALKKLLVDQALAAGDAQQVNWAVMIQIETGPEWQPVRLVPNAVPSVFQHPYRKDVHMALVGKHIPLGEAARSIRTAVAEIHAPAERLIRYECRAFSGAQLRMETPTPAIQTLLSSVTQRYYREMLPLFWAACAGAVRSKNVSH